MRATEPGEQDERLAQDIADRLRNVCRHLPPVEFAALVADLVAMKARFRAIDRNPLLQCHVRDHPTGARERRDWPPAPRPGTARGRDD